MAPLARAEGAILKRMPKRKAVTVAFDAGLYPAKSLRETAAAFAALADVTIAKAGGKHKVTILPREGAPTDEILVGELGNYALGLACAARGR